MPLKESDFYRFHDKVLVGDGCWEWVAGRSGGGYGVFSVENRTRYAHRVAWELWYGHIPDGRQINHRCDNPPCVRPDHLYAGTQAENIVDRDLRSRRPGRRPGVEADGPPQRIPATHCKRGHLWDEANTYVSSTGVNQCRACKREWVWRRRHGD